MNKYFILIGIGVVIIGAGLFYLYPPLPKRASPFPQNSAPVMTNTMMGKTREITITAKENEWRFDPEVIEVNRGDKVIATVVNKDAYDHGFTIDAFGVSERVPAKSSITVAFTAEQEGEFPFYCSVPCGGGEVGGEKRGHFTMMGKLMVRNLVSETK